MTSEENLLQTDLPDVSHLDIKRVCRVLIRIANHFEEVPHEEISTQEQRQQDSTINGMDTRRTEH